MIRSPRILGRPDDRRNRRRGTRPVLEGLEDRIVLYSTLGAWTYDSRITYSFMPDGTNVAGYQSNLFATLNAKYPTATWEQQIEVAATLWENVTGANLSLMPDGGQPFGTQGNQQDDPRFGDIRIGAIPLPSGLLAETFVPPPGNGGTAAGDIFLNSNVNWKIGSNYDLLTVVSHEFGHALGLGESTVSTAVMYGTYNGIKTSLTTDDISGIDSLYALRTPDQFNSNGLSDATYTSAANITPYIQSSNQLSIPGLENMTAAGNEWYYVSAPAGTASTMTATVQATNLSSFAPQMQIYSSSMSPIGRASAPQQFGATISVNATNVTPGAGYFIRVFAAGGPGAIGTYGLQVNFSGQSQAPVAPPNTLVPQQPDQGGGTSNDNAPTGGHGMSWTHVGSWSGWGFDFGDGSSGNSAAAAATNQASQSDNNSWTGIGALPAASSNSAHSTLSTSTALGSSAGSTSSGGTTGGLIVQAIDDVLESLFS
jgi:Matrixin